MIMNWNENAGTLLHYVYLHRTTTIYAVRDRVNGNIERGCDISMGNAVLFYANNYFLVCITLEIE